MRSFVLAALFCLPAAGAAAYEPLGYPGSTWGTLSRDFDNIEGYGTLGDVEQGVDWLKLPGNLVFDTFGGYSWRARSQDQRYFNENGPYAGARLTLNDFSFGADYNWERFPVLRQTTDDFELFGTWYWRKSLGRPSWGGRTALAAPFSTWGRMQYALNNNIEGYGSMGWVQQGVDWFKLPGDVTFETFAAYRWRERSKNAQYYDLMGPAVGIDLIRGPVDLDFEYAWRHYPYTTPQYVNTAQIVLTWYLTWNLKPR